MADLEARLREADAAGARFKMVVSDGVFSMDGTIAPLGRICEVAARFDALVMVDDSHGVGFMGPGGRGTHEHFNVIDKVDILTGTLGKALGGASGGYVSGRREIIDLLRQRSRPYLFSNTLPPAIAAASLAAIGLVRNSPELRERLHSNTRFFREGLVRAGLTIKPGTHPIVPVMLGDAALAQRFSARMLEKGIYVIGFFHPVVAKGAARIRTQVSAAHSEADLAAAIKAFTETWKELAG
jgi:glycine C-acetyltransferase